MSKKASPEQYSPNEELSLSQSTPLQSDKLQAELEVKLDKAGQSYIEDNCGDISGGLYLEKLKRMPNSRVLEKCILSNSSLYTPQELESMGGKKANKAWKKSIKHKGIPLQKLLASKNKEKAQQGHPKTKKMLQRYKLRPINREVKVSCSNLEGIQMTWRRCLQSSPES